MASDKGEHRTRHRSTTATRTQPDRGAGAFTLGRPWSLDDVPLGILVFHGADVVAVNERWTTLTGLDLAASQNDGWLTAANRRNRGPMRAFVRQALAGDDVAGEWCLTGLGGRGLGWVQARARRVEGAGACDVLVTVAEVDARRSSDSKLVHLATHDALTGLLNRTAFIAEVEGALRRAAPDPSLTAVLFIDLDRFKDVNDRLGHHAGDTVLAVAGRRIESSLRLTDHAGRLGGDEIGVLCPVLASRSGGVRLAERIVAALQEPYVVHGDVVLISASVGVAFSDNGSLCAAALVDDADQAMYRAKSEGRARCAVSGGVRSPS